MTDTPPARLQAAAAALEAVDRAQRQWLACAMDRLHAEKYEARYSGDMMVKLRDAEDEARAQMQAAQGQATAALAAVREAVPQATATGDLAGLIEREHETAAVLGCQHPDDEERHECRQ